MLIIPDFMNSDDYLQNPVLQNFCSENNLKFRNTRPECIKVIKEYADSSNENEQKTVEWLEKVAKEGTKEICYKEIYNISEEYFDREKLEEKLRELFPDCPFENVITYRNTYEKKVIKYKIFADDNGVYKISFYFSSYVLTGVAGQMEPGLETIYPVFVDVYLRNKFVFVIGKAKTTIYKYEDEKKILNVTNHIDTQKYIIESVDYVIQKLGMDADDCSERARGRNEKILFNLYNTFSFTPPEVEEKVNMVSEQLKNFVDAIFETFSLDAKNKEIAMADIQIFLEKMISINGDNTEIFKKGRDAYLIKVGANDELQMTAIDTKSTNKKIPLQCTEAFFDSKKSVVKGAKCKKLALCFKRKNHKYFGNTPVEVQFSFKETYGVIKTRQYVEEDDLNNVLQYIFESAERA